jgi:Tfp pilus assembly protein PilO
MNSRERVVLMMAFVLLGGFIFYFMIYNPKHAEYQNLVVARDAVQAELNRDQQVVARAAASRQEYDQMRAHIASVEQKLPQTKEIPALLTAMERFTKEVGVTFQSIKPGALKPVTAASPAAQNAGAGGGATTAANKPLSYSSMEVDLSIMGSFAQTVEYLRGLRDFPRLVIVDSVSVTPNAFPKLGVNIHASIYTLGTTDQKTEGVH